MREHHRNPRHHRSARSGRRLPYGAETEGFADGAVEAGERTGTPPHVTGATAVTGRPRGRAPAVWTGRATNRCQWVAAAAGAACMALGIVIAVESRWNSGVAALLMAVVGCVAAGLLVLFGTLAFVHVAVKVDERAMEVRCGHIGVPRRRIPLSHVVGAEFAPRVTPRQWGGWGYRWRPEKGTAVVVRRGEGLVLRLGDGRTFTVTVDDAESAVRVIRDHLRRPGPPVPPAPTGA